MKVHLPVTSALIITASNSPGDKRTHNVVLMDENNCFCVPPISFSRDTNVTNSCTRARTYLVCQLRCEANSPVNHTGFTLTSPLLQHLCDVHLDVETLFHTFSEGKSYKQTVITREDGNLHLDVEVSLNTDTKDTKSMQEGSAACLNQIPDILKYHTHMANSHSMPRLLSIDEMVLNVASARKSRGKSLQWASNQLFKSEPITWKLSGSRSFQTKDASVPLEFDMAQSTEMRRGAVANNKKLHTLDLTTILAGMVVQMAQQNNITDLNPSLTLQCVLNKIKTSSNKKLKKSFDQHVKLHTVCTTAYCNDPKFGIAFGVKGINPANDGSINLRMELQVKALKEPGEDQQVHLSWTVGNTLLDQMSGLPKGIRKVDCEDGAAAICAPYDCLQLSEMHELVENMETVMTVMPEDYQSLKSSIIELGKCMWSLYQQKPMGKKVSVTSKNICSLIQNVKELKDETPTISALFAKAPAIDQMSKDMQANTTNTKELINETAKQYAAAWQNDLVPGKKSTPAGKPHMAGHAAAMATPLGYVGTIADEIGTESREVHVYKTKKPTVLEPTAYAEEMDRHIMSRLNLAKSNELRAKIMSKFEGVDLPECVTCNITSTVRARDVQQATGLNTNASQVYVLETEANSDMIRFAGNSCFYKTLISVGDLAMVTMQMPSKSTKSTKSTKSKEKLEFVTGIALERELLNTQKLCLQCPAVGDEKLNLHTMGAITSLFTVTLEQFNKLHAPFSPLSARMQTNTNLKILSDKELLTSQNFRGGMIMRGDFGHMQGIAETVRRSYDQDTPLLARGPYVTGLVVTQG